ncbi:MAG TPA: serine hydrolase domain-containing protein [Methylomirabilota bacterium]|nr:serine hydrolase domain-containing protein [Methylomirabilota bacterium]
MSELLTATVIAGQLAKEPAPARPVPWWSLTKPALAAAALVLVAEGRLALDALLAMRPFTLRQLLQHTAGVPDYGGLVTYQNAVARKAKPWSEGELLQRVASNKLLFQPGEGWAYSNVGYLFVRRLIEEMTGEALGPALGRLVFGPLGLDGVRLATEPGDLAATAWGNPAGYHPGWVYHGLLLGTPGEAALFLDRLLTEPLLPEALRAAMGESRRVSNPDPGRPWRQAGYGLGLMINVTATHGRCLGHTGQGPGSVAAAYHFPELDPPRTVAAFAPVQDQAVVERAVLAVP